MAAPTSVRRGAVVLVRFPYSNLSASKLRPAVILAEIDRGDHILIQVTSKNYGDPDAVELTNSDFASGNLRRASFARPGKIFTANSTLVARSVGHLNGTALARVINAVIELLRQEA